MWFRSWGGEFQAFFIQYGSSNRNEHINQIEEEVMLQAKQRRIDSLVWPLEYQK